MTQGLQDFSMYTESGERGDFVKMMQLFTLKKSLLNPGELVIAYKHMSEPAHKIFIRAVLPAFQ